MKPIRSACGNLRENRVTAIGALIPTSLGTYRVDRNLEGYQSFRFCRKMSSSTAPELCSVRRPEEPQTSADLSEPASRQPEKKKRRSADAVALGVTRKQAKYERASLGDGSGLSHLLTGSKARVDPQHAYPSAKKRAKTAAKSSWAEYIEWKKSSSLEVCSKTGAILSITWNRDGEGVRDPLSPGSAKRRKFAVQFLFSEVFGSPKELEWAAPNFHLRLSLPRIIMDMLDVPSNSKEAVITAMRAMIKAQEAGVEYDPSGEIKAGRGAKVLIEDYTPQADVVYRTMESGMSLGNTMVVLNQWRRAKKMTPSSISYGCLQRFVQHSPVIVLEKRETVKAGSADAGTVWAGARWSFAKQVKRQLRKGARIAAGGRRRSPRKTVMAPYRRLWRCPSFGGAWSSGTSTTAERRTAGPPSTSVASAGTGRATSRQRRGGACSRRKTA